MFMAFYRETFPQATVLPKMHIMEEHILPFMEKWNVGCGLMGEQGAESIHAYFNTLDRTYSSIPDRLTRLRQKVKEQHLHTTPANIAACPVPVKRQRQGK